MSLRWQCAHCGWKVRDGEEPPAFCPACHYNAWRRGEVVEREEAAARDQAALDANRDLREAITTFLLARGDTALPLNLGETLAVVDERLETESARIMRKWRG